MSRKNVLTTGEVAKICNVAPRTVSKWFDSGQLSGYRIPGSKDRRIPVDQLVRFMRAHGIPLNGIELGGKRVLVVEGDAVFAEALRKALLEVGNYEVCLADSAFEAGVVISQYKPHTMIVNTLLPDVKPRELARVVRGVGDIQYVQLLGCAKNMNDIQGQSLLQDGFDGYISQPFDVRSLVRMIESYDQFAAPAQSA
jgi:excisionase family DNA binding protein